ncbi:hypothetical protein CBM2597_U10226 [Cupriavidus taiwanensis]|uniref:Uncharacterized protein n=1 Tax=Cupriavidus taiwanensis TaxID=164546 RepID=A0A7Z7JFQ1_9BURK|nr:hypothetical protein CBM2597_U10226 [Cupriavidus taiwanensis]SPC25731.1 hypothetical protein CBM2594_U10232 [Cupriavidus taiwanensis]
MPDQVLQSRQHSQKSLSSRLAVNRDAALQMSSSHTSSWLTWQRAAGEPPGERLSVLARLTLRG